MIGATVEFTARCPICNTPWKIGDEYIRHVAYCSERRIKQLESELAACVGTLTQVRDALSDAGVPCYFGKYSAPSPDKQGFPRDLMDCVKEAVTELQCLRTGAHYGEDTGQ